MEDLNSLEINIAALNNIADIQAELNKLKDICTKENYELIKKYFEYNFDDLHLKLDQYKTTKFRGSYFNKYELVVKINSDYYEKHKLMSNLIKLYTHLSNLYELHVMNHTHINCNSDCICTKYFNIISYFSDYYYVYDLLKIDAEMEKITKNDSLEYLKGFVGAVQCITKHGISEEMIKKSTISVHVHIVQEICEYDNNIKNNCDTAAIILYNESYYVKLIEIDDLLSNIKNIIFEGKCKNIIDSFTHYCEDINLSDREKFIKTFGLYIVKKNTLKDLHNKFGSRDEIIKKIEKFIDL